MRAINYEAKIIKDLDIKSMVNPELIIFSNIVQIMRRISKPAAIQHSITSQREENFPQISDWCSKRSKQERLNPEKDTTLSFKEINDNQSEDQTFIDEPVENHVLKNHVGVCPNYNRKQENEHKMKHILQKEYDNADDYNYDIQSLVQAEIIASNNQLLSKKQQEPFQRAIKVKLRREKCFNINENMKRVYLEVSKEKDNSFLAEKLVKGRLLVVITLQIPFTIQNLKNNRHSTYVCFIGEDLSCSKIIVKGLDNLEIPEVPEEKRKKRQIRPQRALKPTQEEPPLKENEYYLIVLDSIVSSLRQYNSNFNCRENNLMKSIITNQLNQYQTYMPNSQKYDQFIQQSKDILDSSQHETLAKIFKKEKGISLVQGLPGTGKTLWCAVFLFTLATYLHKKSPKGQKNKLLFCVSSNSAADSLQETISKHLNWKGYQPKILRYGYTSQFNLMYLSRNMHHLIEIRIMKTQDKPDEWSAKLRYERNLIQENINNMLARGYEKDHHLIRKQKIKLSEKIEKIYQIQKVLKKRWQEVNAIKRQLMEESDIVICTLNASGSKSFIKFYKGHVYCLVIDEANQATETSTLIPFATMVDFVVLVGDCHQLPPTVINWNSSSTNYNRSLFKRLALRHAPYLLNTQYRMTSEIMELPSLLFYGGNLKNGRTEPIPYSLRLLKQSSTIFFDVPYGIEDTSQQSYRNDAEAQCVVQALKRFLKYDSKLTIGIVSSYKSQIRLIQYYISHKLCLNNKQKKQIKFGSIDNFEGYEVDVILMSTVRSNQSRNIGFLNVRQRVNVAITRAKTVLIIFGSAQTLSRDQTWLDLLNYHKNRHTLHTITEDKCETIITKKIKLQRL